MSDEWRDFHARDGMSTLSIGVRGEQPDVIEFDTRDIGNNAGADISVADIWDVIDYLVDIAGTAR